MGLSRVLKEIIYAQIDTEEIDNDSSSSAELVITWGDINYCNWCRCC